MKILLLTILLFLSSCSLFRAKPIKPPTISERRYDCIINFYKVGMTAKDAKESCGFVLKRR